MNQKVEEAKKILQETVTEQGDTLSRHITTYTSAVRKKLDNLSQVVAEEARNIKPEELWSALRTIALTDAELRSLDYIAELLRKENKKEEKEEKKEE